MNAQTENDPARAVDGMSGFNIPDPTQVERLEGVVSAQEWQIRKNLAATYRLCAMHGWTDLVSVSYTHLTLPTIYSV